jgi:hypothetical protein
LRPSSTPLDTPRRTPLVLTQRETALRGDDAGEKDGVEGGGEHVEGVEVARGDAADGRPVALVVVEAQHEGRRQHLPQRRRSWAVLGGPCTPPMECLSELPRYKKYYIAGTKIYDNIPLGA